MCKNALERERGVYTHTGQRNMAKSFFFLSFTSERYNQILPYSYDLFFLVEETYHFFLFSSNQQHHLKFFKCVFFLLHAHTLYTNKIDVAIKKKALSLTHTRTRSFSRIHSVCPVPCNEGIRPPYARTCCTVARHCNVEADDTPG